MDVKCPKAQVGFGDAAHVRPSGPRRHCAPPRPAAWAARSSSLGALGHAVSAAGRSPSPPCPRHARATKAIPYFE
eukprot:gene12819-biopygen21508